MSSITFQVTRNATAPERINQVFDFQIQTLEELSPPYPVPVRSYVAAKDHKSGRGTLHSVYEVSDIKIIVPTSNRPAAEEMFYSLFDYQIATFNPVNVLYFSNPRDFILHENGFNRPQTLSCDSMIRYTFKVKWQ